MVVAEPLSPCVEVPTGKCTHWNEEKPSNAPCVDTVLTGHVDDVFQTYFGDNTDDDVWDIFMHTDKGMMHYIKEYTRTSWGVDPKGCCAQRTLNFIAPPQDIPMVGKIKVPVKQEHRIHRPSEETIIYRTRAWASNAPYSEVFVCDTRWNFTQISDNQFKLQVFAEILFVQSCWVKSMIRSNAVPATVDGAQKVCKVLKRCNAMIIERKPSVSTPKAAQKRLKRKTTLADMIKEKHQPEAEDEESSIIPEGAPANTVGPTTREVMWAELPPAAKLSAAATCVLGLLELLLFLRIAFIENTNTRIQREITLLGPVLFHAVQNSESAKALWDDLPQSSMSRQLAAIMEDAETSRMLLAGYNTKVESLSYMMRDFDTSSNLVYYLLFGLLFAVPVFVVKSGVGMKKLSP